MYYIVIPILIKGVKKINLMFSFFKSKKGKQVEMERISIDMHSHILPGIDDGAQNVEQSIQLIKSLKNLGYSDFFCTPHVLGDYYPNTDETIQKSFDKFNYHLDLAKVDCKRHAVAEYFYDGRLVDLMESKKIRTYGSTPFFLFELSFRQKPQLLKEFIYNVQMKGYKPILAHPERYTFSTVEFLEDLKNRGVHLQLDLMSLTNNYGKEVKKMADKIVKLKMFDFVGTDIHRHDQIEIVEEALCTKSCHILVNENPLKNNHLKF